MPEGMQIRNLSPLTKRAYVEHVARFTIPAIDRQRMVLRVEQGKGRRLPLLADESTSGRFN